MKKITVFGILIILLAVNIWGCSSWENNSKNESQSTPMEEESQIVNIADNKKESQPSFVIADYSQMFQSIQGCAVILDTSENKCLIYNEEQSKIQVSPCSTFKIVSSLMGLHNQVITSSESKMGYDGTKYPMKSWNDDLSLKDAFENSCIWYFKKVLNEVGQEKVKKELESLYYGNCDITEWEGNNVNPSPELNGFWLESSLLISPLEQVQVLQTIIEGNTSYNESEVEILKSIMKIETDNEEKIYGKTGSGGYGNAWFVGFMEPKNGGNIYFAIYLNDDTGTDTTGAKAKEIALSSVC